MNMKSLHLEATRVIHTKLKASKLSNASKQKVKKELNVVMEFFNIQEMEAMVLSSIVQESFLECEVDIKSIANHYAIDWKIAPAIFAAAEYLAETCYIVKCDPRRRIYAPMTHVLNALMSENATILKPKKAIGISDVITEFRQLHALHKQGSISLEKYNDRIVGVYRSSGHLPAIQYLMSLDLSNEEVIMLLYLALRTSEGMDMIEVSAAIREITEDTGNFYDWRARFRTQELKLFKEGLIEFSLFEIGIDTEVSITDLTKEKLFSNELAMLTKYVNTKYSKLILPQNITPVKLIFDESISANLDRITTALEQEKYKTLCNMLKERKLKGGLIILLHGMPGTGKTETVYQMAQKTERAILRAEISQVRGMWVGESEKNLKGIFREYNQAKKSLDRHPILLFNEADAIFSKRRNINSSVDQMENSMQNILLQELEEFEGIMVATTNLTQNLDPAFERRFLYKVYFTMPSEEVRHKLLSAAFSEIPTTDLRALADEYKLTGSNIENIKRKMAMMELTDFDYKVDSNSLRKILSEETIKPERKPIGFKISGL